MTDKQIASVKAKIEKYKKALTADKKYWGGQYHDGQGIRYIIPEQFIKIGDYKGGLRYLNWFDKNFPNDSGYSIFLFEWTFILFKCNNLIKAEQKAHRTFFSNTYLFDKFLGKQPLQLDKNESPNWEYESLVENFAYSRKDTPFIEFANWTEAILNTKNFLDKANEFSEIERQLIDEPAGHRRTELVNRLSKIEYG
ncbi:hypothetical protein GCM10022408_15910 [Hymenobacter fastidiosus]|uniref:Uncharacterized protein n=1 Tax=Hymenobacter fastidiosus TaxID=486264 RepID=A0ABP7S0X9_9BACT